MQRKKSKTKLGYRETKARQCRLLGGIFFLEPNDEEFKLTLKAPRRKLEVPMPAAMLRNTPIKSSGETHRDIGKRNTKNAFVVDADESTRPRLEGDGHTSHQDRITAKGTNSFTHNSLVRKFMPVPRAVKNSRCKGSSGERM